MALNQRVTYQSNVDPPTLCTLSIAATLQVDLLLRPFPDEDLFAEIFEKGS